MTSINWAKCFLPISALFAQRCLGCGEYFEGVICAKCEAAAPRLTRHCLTCAQPLPDARSVCGRCLKTPRSYQLLIAALRYEGCAREWVLAAKLSKDKARLNLLAQLLADKVEENATALMPLDLVIPIPISTVRLAERGYNQTHYLAKAVAKRLAGREPLRYAPSVLASRARVSQGITGKTLAQRQRNMQDAFYAVQTIEGKRVLLVDDVITTGSTLNAASKVLYQAGAAWVGAAAAVAKI